MKAKNKLKNIYILISLALCVLMASIFGFISQPKFETVDAILMNEEISLSDPDFDATSGSTYPFQPSTNNYTTSSSGENHVTAGIINLSNSAYSSYPKNKNQDEDCVLMISSGVESEISDDDTIEYRNVKYGYITTSGQIELDADSYYELSVDVLTQEVENSGGIGALYLFDADNDDAVIAKIENIDTNNTWNRYYFFIETNDITNYNLKLGLYLNGSGTVLFDNLSLVKNSKQSQDLQMEELDGYYTLVEKQDNIISSYTVDAGNLTFDVRGADISSVETIDQPDGTSTLARHIVVDGQNVNYTMSNDITFGLNKVYKITAYIKAVDVSNVSLNLVPVDESDTTSDEEDVEFPSVTISASSTNDNATNGYVPYSFYVISSANEELTYNLVLSVGDYTNDETTGVADLYVSRINVGYCNYADYSSPADNSDTINLAENELSSTYFTNGNFDSIEIEDYTNPYPATPTDWTVTDNSNGNGTVFYGVINGSQADGLSNSQIPAGVLGAIPTNSKGNFLMMYSNLAGNNLSYLSSSVALSSSSYYRFSANVLAGGEDATISLVTMKDDEEIVLVSRTIEPNDAFSTFNLYLYTGYQTADVYFKITVNGKTYPAYAFLDEVQYVSITESVYNNQTDSLKADLTFGLNNKTFSTVEGEHANLSIRTENNRQMLHIETIEPSYATVESNYGFSLTSGSYYRLSLRVRTEILTWNTDDESVNESDVGVSFGLTGYDNFSAIKSDGWTTYTFYINPSTDSTVYLTFAIGTSTINVGGSLDVSDILFETIEEADFNSAPDNNTTLILTTIEEEEETPEEETDPEEEESTPFNWNNLLYLLSSVIFALSIIVAIVGIVTRKFKKKKPAKKSKTSYDRNKTVSVQVSSREASIMRESRIAELNKELAGLIEERSKYEEEYKHNLTKVRELKIKRAPANEINDLNKELKKNQKRTSAIGVNINKLEAEIEYTKSNMYLSTLMKKLERGDIVFEEKQTEEEVNEKEDLNSEQTSKTELKKSDDSAKTTKKTTSKSKNKSTAKTTKKSSNTTTQKKKATTTSNKNKKDK